jgi:hypothetical protein
MIKKPFPTNLSVLATRDEDGEWTAHCLDFDLIGTGPTPGEALEDMLRAVTSQASFARFKGDWSLLIGRTAPRECWDMFHDQISTQIVDRMATWSPRAMAGFAKATSIEEHEGPSFATGANG